jgi:nitrogen fixation-related uncharacterized protein
VPVSLDHVRCMAGFYRYFWGGYSGYFSDPDGHTWEIAYNPFWTIQKDGRVSMTKN